MEQLGVGAATMMRAYLVRRLARALLSAVFLLAAAAILGAGSPASGDPLSWAGAALRLDPGRNTTGQPVAEALGAALPASVLLAAAAALILVALGWGGGLILALGSCAPGRRTRRRVAALGLGRVVAAVAGVAQALPIFWLGGLLVGAVSVGAGWLPPGGISDPTLPALGGAGYLDALGDRPLVILGDLVRHLLLPACTLALAGLSTAPRLLLAVLPAEWVAPHMLVARAAGLDGRRLAWRALRPVSPQLLGGAAEVPLLLSALVLVEYLYGWPGLGLLAYHATRAGDTRTLGAVLLLFGLVAIMAGLLADLLAALADPRLRGGPP